MALSALVHRSIDLAVHSQDNQGEFLNKITTLGDTADCCADFCIITREWDVALTSRHS